MATLASEVVRVFRLWRLRDNSHRDARLNVRAPKPRLGVEPKVRDVGWLVPLFCPASTGGTAESMGCGQRVAMANGKDPHERVHSRWPHRPVHSRRHALYRSYDRSPWHRRGTGGNRVLYARRLRACRRGGGRPRAWEDGRARRVVASFGGAPRCGGAVPSRGGHGGGAAYGIWRGRCRSTCAITCRA